MKTHSAQEPFTEWVKRVAGTALKDAGAQTGDWQSLHARERAGAQPLSVNGTQAQMAAILEAAVQRRAPITFADPVMEAERQRRVAEAIEAENALAAAEAKAAGKSPRDGLREEPEAEQADPDQIPPAQPLREQQQDRDEEMEM